MVENPAKAKQRKGASPTDGARVTFRKDANGNVPLEQRTEQLVLPRRSLDDGIFMHPNQDSITFCSRINYEILY